MNAEIIPLSNQLGMANAHAVFGDALNRCGIEQPAVALWLDEGGRLRWSAHCNNMQLLWMLRCAEKEVFGHE